MDNLAIMQNAATQKIDHLANFRLIQLMQSDYRQIIIVLCSLGLASACSEEQPVRSVNQFLEDPIMLEAAMVRCAQDRQQTRYDAECVNARQAVSQIEAKEEALRRAEFEARSDAKRQALRRAQAAAAEARRRAAEADRLRREAEYLAQFGVELPPDTPLPDESATGGNTPLVVIPQNETPVETAPDRFSTVPATDGGNAPGNDSQPEATPTDLESIRDELQRRNEESGDQS